MRPLFLVISCVAALLATAPASAESACESCPDVKLTAGTGTVRIDAEDDNDPADELKHRLRLRTGATASAWSAWSGVTEYEIAPGARGFIEAQTLDSEGYVGIGYIEWDDDDTGPIGPAEERDTTDSYRAWEEDALEPGQAMTEETPAPVRPVEEYADLSFDQQEHCPESTCSTAAGDRQMSGSLLLLGLGLLLIRRRD